MERDTRLIDKIGNIEIGINHVLCLLHFFFQIRLGFQKINLNQKKMKIRFKFNDRKLGIKNLKIQKVLENKNNHKI